MVSTDEKILQKGSEVQKRMEEYGSLIDELNIIVFSKSNKQIDLDNNVKVFSTNSSYKIFYFRDGIYTAKKNIKSDIDLVTCQDPFETGLAGWMISKKLKAKLQLQIHTDFLSPYFSRESLKNKVRVWIAKYLLPKADSIRVVSERIKKSVINLGLPEEKIILLPIFVDVEKIINTPTEVDLHDKYKQFDFILLMTSRFEPEKNIGMVIDSMKDLAKENPKLGLLIVGDGSQKEKLQRKVLDNKLDKNIIFERWVNDLSSYHKTADVFINTSNYEGYGMSLIMAAAAGSPIITTDVGLVDEIIKHKENGLVVLNNNKEKLVRAILRLMSDKALGEGLGKSAQDAVSKLDNKEEYLKKYKQSWEI